MSGFRLGAIVDTAMFAVLVLVALVTTLMTVPLLTLIERREARRAPSREPVSARVEK